MSGADVTTFIGGIVEKLFKLIGDRKTVTVVEADEFDRSFFVACTSMDADHLDIYGRVMQSKHHFRIWTVEDKSQLF
jgi:UDP-N-acetylmuramate--alanine ligase